MRSGSSGISVFLGIALGALMMLVILGFLAHDDASASAAVFKNATSITLDKTKGPYMGSVSNGTWVGNGDVIQIKAMNVSTPIRTTDLLLVDLKVTSGSSVKVHVSLLLNYSGSGKVFVGDLRLNTSNPYPFNYTNGGLVLNAKDGYNVSVIRHLPVYEPMAHFMVDASPPSIGTKGSASNYQSFGDAFYMRSNAVIELSVADSDPSADSSYFASGSNVQYHWNSASWSNWGGNSVVTPSSEGRHILHVKAVDRFGQTAVLDRVFDTMSMPGPLTISGKATYSNTAIFIQNSTITSGGSLELTNATLGFLGNGVSLVIENGGSLKMGGPDSATSVLRIGSSGRDYRIDARRGSTIELTNTTVYATGNTRTWTLSMYAGTIRSSEFIGLRHPVRMLSTNATMLDTGFVTAGGAGLDIDLNHTWTKDPLVLKNLKFEGPSSVPLSVSNASVWRTHLSREVLYAGDEDRTYLFRWDRSLSTINSPYIEVPYFVDSRSSDAVLEIEYFDGTDWTELAQVRNTVTPEWIDGGAARIDVSSTPLISDFKISWSVSGPGQGCAYIQKPVYGGLGSAPVSPPNPISDWVVPATDVLTMNTVTMQNASVSFLDIISSGGIDIFNLKTGDPSYPSQAGTGVRLTDCSVRIRNSTIMTDKDGSVGIVSSFMAGDDWGWVNISHTKIDNDRNDQSRGIDAEGGYLYLNDDTILDSKSGVVSTNAMINVNKIVIKARIVCLDVVVPEYFVGAPSLSLYGVNAQDHSGSGIRVKGTVNERMDIRIRSFSVSSSVPGDYERTDAIGGITLAMAGPGVFRAALQGEVSDGAGHGISVSSAPSDTIVNITSSTISSMELDGLYIGAPCEVNAVGLSSENNLMQGIYLCSGSKLTVGGRSSMVRGNQEGGIHAESNTVVSLSGVNCSLNNGPGLHLSVGSEADISNSGMYRNTFGIESQSGSTLTIAQTVIGNNSRQGIRAKDTDLTFRAPSSDVSANQMDGIFADGGSIDALSVNTSYNTGDGVRLWNVKLVQMNKVRSDHNSGNGLSVHIGSTALLDPDGSYGRLTNMTVAYNTNNGIILTYDPSNIVEGVEIKMDRIKLHSNGLMDLDSPSIVHITWTMRGGLDLIGSTLSTGKARANMDIIALGSPTITNEVITLLGDGNSFTVPERNQLTFNDVHLSPVRSSYRINITIHTMGSLTFNGGSVQRLEGIDASVAKKVVLENAEFRDSRGPIVLGCTFTVSGCTFDGAPDEALVVIDKGIGTIEDTRVMNSTVGMRVVGNMTGIAVSGGEFSRNEIGIVFDSENPTYINGTSFISNTEAPLQVLKGNVSLFDSTIEKAKVDVERAMDRVDIGYTLNAQVLDEEGGRVPFVMNLTRGTANPERTEYRIGPGQGNAFSKGLVSYMVYKGNTIVTDYVSVSVDIDHGYKEKTIRFNHTEARDITVLRYTPPVLQPANVKYTLNAFEDKGLKNGPEDVRTWFKDSPSDTPNLNFTTRSLGNNVKAFMQGSVLNVTLKKDWHGSEKVQIVATDPHGKSCVHEVTIMVQAMNDLPTASNARILVNGVASSTARTGDNLTAAWDWTDIDGDDQPDAKNLVWFLNGVMQPSLSGVEVVRNVQPGQYWNFTVYPADGLSYGSGKFGPPVNSPGIMVGNVAPTLEGVTIANIDPTTDEVLVAKVGKWSDPDSPRVYFHYEWQKRTGGVGQWIVLSAPDAPSLPGSYFQKGDVIMVKAWVSDGFSESDPRTATVTIANSPPTVLSARLEPEVVNERTPYVRVVDVETYDPDSESVVLNYVWMGSDQVLDSGVVDVLYRSKWSYPDNVNITVRVVPYDTESLEGTPLVLKFRYVPTDTDGDGLYDDANGNGTNDPGDDEDDDDDGFNDTWELILMKDPQDPLSYPQDWDRDGDPDGDARNTEDWMDTDDDNDGIPDTRDNYPLNPTLPGDMDDDGVGDDADPDIDGDGVPNDEDQDPRNKNIGRAPTGLQLSGLEIALIIVLVLIIAAIAATGYAVYNGKLNLPTNAPPEVAMEKGKAVRPYPFRSKREIALEALEDVDLSDMFVCSECGEVVKKEDDSCPNCGSVFSENPEDFTALEDEEEFEAEEE